MLLAVDFFFELFFVALPDLEDFEAAFFVEADLEDFDAVFFDEADFEDLEAFAVACFFFAAFLVAINSPCV
ncbi:MAG: hypothetical protein QOK48_3046 [Blastocatellia bacterium]|nr:hypothetical protein [Blastocatellia bacterium]